MENFFVDTHAHYDNKQFSSDRESLIAGLPSSGIGLVINPGCDEKSSVMAQNLASRYEHVFAAVGWHPHDASAYPTDGESMLIEWAQHKKVVAIGEIGLDFHYDYSPRDTQRAVFVRQMKTAAELNLPVIIHDREAHEECLNIVRKYNKVRGVFHCFSGSAEMAKIIVSLGFSISFTGSLTFKNARRARECVAAIPIERIMLETDCPYMAPEPFRGKRCDSTMIPRIAEVVAEIKGISLGEVARITTQNAKELFKI